MPQVIVMVPTFNRPSMLKEALRSLVAQTFRDWRAIVADNGGCCGADQIVSGMDPRIGYMWFPPAGAGKNGNRLMRFWEDGYGCFLHDDDTLHPENLARRVSYLDSHPEIGCVATAMMLWDGQRSVGIRDRDPASWSRNFEDWYDNTNTPSLMFRSRKDVLPVSEEWVTGIGDTVWQYEMFMSGVKFGYIADPIYNYRLHENQASNPSMMARHGQVLTEEIRAVHLRAKEIEVEHRKM